VVLQRSSWRWELRAIASVLRSRVGGGNSYSTSDYGFLEDGSPIFGVSAAAPSYADANGDGLLARTELVQPVWNVDLRPSTPTFEGALHSTVTFGSRLTLLTIVDRHGGHYAIPGTEAIHCAQPNCREGQDLAATLAEQAHAMDLQSGRRAFSDAGFTRLREVALRWVLAPVGSDARLYRGATLIVAGRDLATWSGWRGLDPEINTNGRRALVQTDRGGAPLPRRVSIGLELGSGTR
jgi:TonB-dependent starch-binding outer membrane protein SusC